MYLMLILFNLCKTYLIRFLIFNIKFFISMKVSKKKKLKAIYDEDRYIIYINGLIQRRSDLSFVKPIFRSKYDHQDQYNLYTDAYGSVCVKVIDLVNYAEEYYKKQK